MGEQEREPSREDVKVSRELAFWYQYKILWEDSNESRPE